MTYDPRPLDAAIDRLLQVIHTPAPAVKGGADFKNTDVRLARAELHRIAAEGVK